MDSSTPMTFTSLALILLLLVLFVMFACHYLGPRANTWMRSNKEEKIGLSKNKLFHANGYMVNMRSGSEFLLTTSGSFKRFDTVDKEDYRQAGQHPTQQSTTPLWNVDSNVDIPPQPLRPAPAPHSAGHSKTVTFSFTKLDEIPATDEPLGASCMRYTSKPAPIPLPLEAPPPPRLSSSSSITLSSTAIPRPIAKRQISLQNGALKHSNGVEAAAMVNQRHPHKPLTRRNSSTNPFLCEESVESLTAETQTVTTATSTPTTNAESNNNRQHMQPNSLIAQVEVEGGRTTPYSNGNNPFQREITSATNGIHKENGLGSKQQHAEAPDSNIPDLKALSSKIATAGLNRLNNRTNPFTGLSQKVKGPHMLQKTISEDFLFRKLGVTHMNGAKASHAHGGNATWSFGRSFMRQDSSFSLGRRNSSQCSLDGAGSTDSINIERAISCESVNSDSSVFLSDLDQPYTQITGYLCVGLSYDRNSITSDGMDFTVTVVEAKGLLCPLAVESLDTFVRIYLVPDQAGAMQTKVVTNSQTPNYNESFNFWLKKQQGRHSLWFHLYHDGAAHTLIGEAEMEIGEIPRPITTWIPLSDSRKFNAQWGELMFSLSYLPTAERLTIVVVKARNLKLNVETDGKSGGEDIQNVFVKVYIMNNDKKVLKKRTSYKRSERFPVFNESMMFSVPPQSLTTVQLRLTVFGVNESNGVVPLGHVIAGSCATGKGLRHWHQMLSSLRKPVSMWHVLRRVANQPIFTGGVEAVVAAMQSTALRHKRNSII